MWRREWNDPIDSSKLEEEIVNQEVHQMRCLRDDHNRHLGGTRFKVDIPYFDGQIHIEEYLDKELVIENFFKYTEITVDK